MGFFLNDKKRSLFFKDQSDWKALLQSARSDEVAFARLLTEIDSRGVDSLRCVELLEPPRLAFRIGVTGCMGVGKSVLINALLHVLGKDLKVGVLAVDPTSPLSRGAVLGDRIRLSAFSSRVFFRSIGSRDGIGGLCGQAYLMLRAFDWAGFDVVFVETVGVGQTEWEIMHVADHVALVLGPENGDSIQLMKSGLMEIADVFIINKSDREGSDLLRNQLLQQRERSGQVRSVFSTVATDGQGVEALWEYFSKRLQDGVFQEQRWSQERLQAEARALLRLKVERTLLPSVLNIKTCRDLQSILN